MYREINIFETSLSFMKVERHWSFRFLNKVGDSSMFWKKRHLVNKSVLRFFCRELSASYPISGKLLLLSVNLEVCCFVRNFFFPSTE